MIRIWGGRRAAAITADEGAEPSGCCMPSIRRIESRHRRRRGSGVEPMRCAATSGRQPSSTVSGEAGRAARLLERDFPASHPFGRITVAPNAGFSWVWLLGSAPGSASAAAHSACLRFARSRIASSMSRSMISGA